MSRLTRLNHMLHTYARTAYVYACTRKEKNMDEKMDAVEWLRDFLEESPREVSEVRAASKAAGFTRGEIKEAKHELQVKTTSNWSPGQPATVWYWSLP